MWYRKSPSYFHTNTLASCYIVGPLDTFCTIGKHLFLLHYFYFFKLFFMNYSLILITRFSSPLGMKLKLHIDSVASKHYTFFCFILLWLQCTYHYSLPNEHKIEVSLQNAACFRDAFWGSFFSLFEFLVLKCPSK